MNLRLRIPDRASCVGSMVLYRVDDGFIFLAVILNESNWSLVTRVRVNTCGGYSIK